MVTELGTEEEMNDNDNNNTVTVDFTTVVAAVRQLEATSPYLALKMCDKISFVMQSEKDRLFKTHPMLTPIKEQEEWEKKNRT